MRITPAAGILSTVTAIAILGFLLLPPAISGPAAAAAGRAPLNAPFVTDGETCPDAPSAAIPFHRRPDAGVIGAAGGDASGPGTSLPAAPPPDPILSADTLIPGTPALIVIDGRDMPPGWVPVVKDPQGPVKMYRHRGVWRGYAAAGYRLSAGRYDVVAAWCHLTLGVKAFEKTLTIGVPERTYTLSRITVTEQVAATRTPELLREDRRWTDAARASSRPRPLWSGPFILPLDSRRTTGFGHIRYVNGVESGRHTGIDIAAPLGTPVAASHHGRVALARMLNAGGNTVIIDHGLNLNTSYLHLNEIAVQPGQWVRQGDVIGYVGTTGFSTGPHLHWAAHIGSHPMDADTLLQLADGTVLDAGGPAVGDTRRESLPRRRRPLP